MAKYRRYRKYTRRSNRWASNIQELGTTTIVSAGQGANSHSFTLAFNPTQVNTAVSQVFTVKNFEVSFNADILSSATTNTEQIEDITAYIMFVPQGMNITTSYNLEHPEYIMAYKFIGSPNVDVPQSQAQPTKIMTRLSRRLNTGDSVILFIKFNDTRADPSSTTPRMNFHGIARWWTKAN